MSIVQTIQSKINSTFAHLQTNKAIWVVATGFCLLSFLFSAIAPADVASHISELDKVAGDYQDGNGG